MRAKRASAMRSILLAGSTFISWFRFPVLVAVMGVLGSACFGGEEKKDFQSTSESFSSLEQLCLYNYQGGEELKNFGTPITLGEIRSRLSTCLGNDFESRWQQAPLGDTMDKLVAEVKAGESLLCVVNNECGCQVTRHVRGAGIRLFAKQDDQPFVYLMETSQTRFRPDGSEKSDVRSLSYSLGEKLQWVGIKSENAWDGLVRALKEEADMTPNDVVFYDSAAQKISSPQWLPPLGFYEGEVPTNFPGIPTFSRIALYLAHVTEPQQKGYLEKQLDKDGKLKKEILVEWYSITDGMSPWYLESPVRDWEPDPLRRWSTTP